MLDVFVAPSLAAVVRLGVLALEGAQNAEAESKLDAPLAAAAEAARQRPPGDTQAVRAMYRRVGLDPTKTRPSSEALLRRVRRGESLPRINTLVDVCNWCSLEFQLPYGLYDLECVRPPVTLRLGEQDEGYPGIRKEYVSVAGRIALADADGPFGNPTSDSARTMVSVATSRVLCAVFAPRASDDILERVLRITAERFGVYASARLEGQGVI
jgi:DNA/RNA-binding domain of Phe-tRNA-synthetase-like protein